MTLSLDIREYVRTRAQYVCEYCGVHEARVGSELTVDHYHPRSLGGSDHPENLLYCCARCNLNKRDYWHGVDAELAIWNPRTSPFEEHMVVLNGGIVSPITLTGRVTIDLLRLNRPQLIAYRVGLREQEEALRMLDELRAAIATLEQTNQQHQKLILIQKQLLHRQAQLIRALLNE
jgi:hypothetical protein